MHFKYLNRIPVKYMKINLHKTIYTNYSPVFCNFHLPPPHKMTESFCHRKIFSCIFAHLIIHEIGNLTGMKISLTQIQKKTQTKPITSS